MAAVRELLVDTSEKLKLAFSDLRTVDEEVVAISAAVSGLPLSEAASRVLQGARTAAAVASKVLKAAKVAEAEAGKAAAAVTAAEEAKAAAQQAEAEAAKAVAIAAQKTEAAAAVAAAALEVKIQPSVPFSDTYVTKWLRKLRIRNVLLICFVVIMYSYVTNMYTRQGR